MAVPKSPFCSLSAALRKLLHPHLRIRAKSKPSAARPLSLAHPSVRTYHSLSLVLSIIARGASLAAPLHFFARPSLNAVSIPRDTSKFPEGLDIISLLHPLGDTFLGDLERVYSKFEIRNFFFHYVCYLNNWIEFKK